MRLSEGRVRADLARIHVAFRRLPDGDYQVNPADKKRAGNFYITNDLADAYETGKSMGVESHYAG